MTCPKLARLISKLSLLPLFAAALFAADQRLFVQASINGHPVQLAFDTGASHLVITRRGAVRAGLSVTAPASGAKPSPGDVLTGLSGPVRLELFGQVLPDVRLHVLEDFGPGGADVDGLIGWSSVRKNIWRVNGATHQFTSLTSVPREAETWLQLREVPDQRILTVTLPQTTAARPAFAGIDTGSPYGLKLSPAEWKRWRAQNPQAPVTLIAYFQPGIGVIVEEEAWAHEIELFGLTLRDVPVTASPDSALQGYPAGTVAVLGLAAVLRMDVIFDGRAGLVYAHALTLPPPPRVHNRLGAVFVPRGPGDDALCAHVAKDSPAEVAGVKDGDVLMRIDDLDVTPWRTKPGILPLSRFGELPAGTKLRLQLRRANTLVTVEPTLRDILGPR